MALDEFESDDATFSAHEHWWSVLKHVRAGVMPPSGKPQPTEDEKQLLADWIKRGVFGIDQNDPDPGRVTLHRLNRQEYRHTIKQILGVDYDTEDEFPPDAAGLGFDNIADLLTMSPLVLEKYLKAAEIVLDGALPSEEGRAFIVPGQDIRGNNDTTGELLSFGGSPEVVYAYRNKYPGSFRVEFDIEVNQGAGATTNVTHFAAVLQSGDKPEEVLLNRYFTGESNIYHFVADKLFSVEPHVLRFKASDPALLPQAPSQRRFNRFAFQRGFRRVRGDDGRIREFRGSRRSNRPDRPPTPDLKITNLRFIAQPTPEVRRFFPADAPPNIESKRRDYIRRGIAAFGLQAFRRPMDERTLNILTAEIEQTFSETGRFADSVNPSFAKILCSPRFLFRTSSVDKVNPDEPWSLIDEYSLASRLSYFLWSTMPDEELLNLAARGELRANLEGQVKRMLSHHFGARMVENFVGQWLQTRNVMDWTIVESQVLKREELEAPYPPLLNEAVRSAMVKETEMYVSAIVLNDRSVLELIDSDYTFLNEPLANYYGIPDVTGDDMRVTQLPDGSPRGGVITQGSTLLVSSNPNRTSAVKRGLFVLENILGLRPNDPPPNIPGIEQASADIQDHEPSFREMLELHRKDALCASCHNLMDPIGLGLDNFNAMGRYRETEYGQPIDASGKLASGKAFNGAKELKQILLEDHRSDFYRCLTEKLMTYALGRGLDYYDVESVDQIVERLEIGEGKFSSLLMGIIESAPFQKRRNREPASAIPSATKQISTSSALQRKPNQKAL